MADGLAYPAARAVASTVYEHFVRHRAEAARAEIPMAPLPQPPQIETIVENAFWASLRRAEGYVPRISLAFLPPTAAPNPMLFARPLRLVPHDLTRVAPAVERAGIHLGVWVDDGELVVWGTTHGIPPFCFVLEVAAPGLLVIKHHRGDQTEKFTNVAVLEGDQVKVIDEHASSLPDCPSLLAALIGFDAPSGSGINILVELAVSMRAHQRGGMLLIVPDAGDGWRESIVRPIPYAVDPAFTELSRLGTAAAPERGHAWRSDVVRAVGAIAGLTAVDGATIMTTHYRLLAFGAKIARRTGSPQVERIAVTEPVEGAVAVVVEPSQLGGTRHLSAAQFVHDQRNAMALVASQDGHFTIFAWSPCEDMVHGHRVETLLL